ncbi:type I-F CRISPR-associated protein Csy1 [Oceaniserpentilla sp. 4NH20-0058]|uniref:type I-F CRISPR-associated protein Csy1 n=1 Tax=Oceaniserpentilla sp. 4NH20-0058 TaxID=3127660 RepID=UPI0031030531
MEKLDEAENLSWEQVIRAFLKGKRDAEEEAYLKKELKEISGQFEKVHWLSDESIKVFFDAKKNKKTECQTSLDFQQNKFQEAMDFTNQPDSLDWNILSRSYQQKCVGLDEKYAPSRWLSESAKNANSVSFATHVVKLTHSKIDTPSLFDQVDVTTPNALVTAHLSEKMIDGAVAGNQFSPIFQFLELELNGTKLLASLIKTDSDALKAFARDDAQLMEWNKAFKQSSVAEELASHALLKQVYFPVTENVAGQYHLLSSVISSSLAHALYERLFNEQQKQVGKYYEKGKYSCDPKVFYPRRANVAVTASNHSNASQLNGKRGGRLYLLSAQPPIWEAQTTPPLHRKSWFDYGIPNYAVKEDIQYLREFLIRFERLELSTRDPKKRKWLVDWGNQIVDEVLNQASAIHSLPSGWSAEPTIKLKFEHQCFLDPYRADEEFQAKRAASDWQKEVCRNFAGWLNRHLKGRDNRFTPQAWHTKLWVALMEPQLRELNQTMKVELASKEVNA